MRIGNMIFKWSADEDNLPVPPPPIPVFDDREPAFPQQPEPQQQEMQQEPEEPEEVEEEVAGEDISDVPGVEFPDAPAPEVAALTPGSAENRDLASIIESYEGNDRIKATRAAAVAQADPKAYYKSHRLRYPKDRFYDPITAWVLDNQVIPNTDLAIDWLETQNKRAEVEFYPYVHHAFATLLQEDPLRLLAAENVWKGSKVGNISTPYLPALWEASLRVAEPNEQGRLFVNDDVLFKLQALGRELGRRGHPEFFQNRALPVLETMIDLRLDELKRDTSRSPMEKRTDLMTFKQWRNQLNQINRRIEMEKNAGVRALMQLAKVATILDVKGEYELASELDSLLTQAAEKPSLRDLMQQFEEAYKNNPRYFVDKRTKEERDKDPTEKEPGFGVYKERMPRPMENDPRHYMIDPEYGYLEEAPEGLYVEEEWEPKSEKQVDRETDVEEVSEQDLDPEYLEETRTWEELDAMEEQEDERKQYERLFEGV